MANSFLALPAPAGNASGAAVDVSTLGATKTIVVEGNGSGLYEPYVQIEVSNDNAFQIWTPLYRFLKPGSVTLTVACRYMRATVQNYVQGGAPTVNLGAEATGADFFELVAPAGNGFGASVDVSAFPALKTFQVSGRFKGSMSVQISNDAGVTWSQADGLAFRNKGGIVTIVIVAQYMRLARSGIQAREPNPGLPVCDVGCALEAGSGGGITGTGTANRVAKFTGSSSIGNSSVTDNGTTVVGTLPTTMPEITLTPAISPAALAAGDTDNYDPTSFGVTSRVRIATNAAGSTITGAAAQGDGEVRIWENLGPGILTLANERTSTLVNRFTGPGGADVTVPVGGAAITVYDATAARWKFEAVAGLQAGSLLNVQKLAGAGTYTPTPGTKRAWVRMVGGGGGGGNAAATTAGNATAAGGGGSGTWLERMFTNLAGIAGGAYSVGAGGTPGNDGADTTLTIEAVALTAGGGGNGSPSADGQTFVNAAAGGQGGLTAATGGTTGFCSAGQGGWGGVALADGVAWGGAGGSTPFGAGGRQAQGTSGAPGVTGFSASANAFGGGGGGGVNASAPLAARSGGSGAAGTIIIYEYA